MALAVAIALAVFVLPRPWGVAAVVAALAVEIAETALWVRLSQRRRPRVGVEALVGKEALVVAPCRPLGQVRVDGELWRARADAGADEGATVRVRGVDGLTLLVEP